METNFRGLLAEMPGTGLDALRALTQPVLPISHFVEKALRLTVFNNPPEAVQRRRSEEELPQVDVQPEAGAALPPGEACTLGGGVGCRQAPGGRALETVIAKTRQIALAKY